MPQSFLGTDNERKGSKSERKEAFVSLKIESERTQKQRECAQPRREETLNRFLTPGGLPQETSRKRKGAFVRLRLKSCAVAPFHNGRPNQGERANHKEIPLSMKNTGLLAKPLSEAKGHGEAATGPLGVAKEAYRIHRAGGHLPLAKLEKPALRVAVMPAPL